MRGSMPGRMLLSAAVALAACTLAPANAASAGGATPDPAPAPQVCPPPPAVDTTKYFNTQGGQPWDQVEKFIADSSVSFEVGVSDVRRVRLCDGAAPSCQPLLLQLRSEEGTTCLTQESLQGQLRMVGTVQARGAGYRPAFGLGPDNYDHLVYLLLRDSTVYALYQNLDGRTAFARPDTVGNRWYYAFHPEVGVAEFEHPGALWKQRTKQFNLRTAVTAEYATETLRARRGGPAEPVEFGAMPRADGEAAQTFFDYGWMACAAGCCQFHGSPPGGPPLDDDEEHHGHGNHGHGHGGRERPNPRPEERRR
jgi:hypothetical protein